MQINSIPSDPVNFSVENLPSYPFSLTLPFLLLAIFIYKCISINVTSNKNLPPSPPKLPIIGNLHQLGEIPHRSLRSLSYKYGELMLLYLGNRPTLVVCTANAAKQVMKTHDIPFANRPKLRSIDRIFYEGNNVAFGPYGEKWRYMKSISTMQLLSKKKVQSFRKIREEEVTLLLQEIKSYYDGSILNLSETYLMFFKNLISRTAFGKKYNGDDGSKTDFYKLFKELIRMVGEPSIGDNIPLLSWIDRLSGLEGRIEYVHKKLDAFCEEVIKEHQIRRSNANRCNFDDNKDDNVKDFVEVLLDVQSENPLLLSTDGIKGVILDMFVAGTETSSTALEWAITELIRNPEVMKKLQQEVRHIIKTNTRVSEDDLENMKYLKAVIKETLRLHPPVTIIFRQSSQDVEIGKYYIGARTQAMINVWAVQRDPRIWQDPEVFKPERFLNDSSSLDFKGQDLCYIPFGAGRRGCPGISYSMANVELVLATLVHEFNFTLPNGREGTTLDVAERIGITVGRRNPLMVVATPSIPCSCV